MQTLHTFGCSVTQGFSLPDVVKPLSDQDIHALGREPVWTDVHVLAPSVYAWPSVLARLLDIPVINSARRGACWRQIATQCAVAASSIQPDDTVIVMWSYLNRLSLRWPSRTSVPYASDINSDRSGMPWRSLRLGFNKLCGLDRSSAADEAEDQQIQQWIRTATKTVYADPKDIYDRYYNNMLLQQMTDQFLRSTGARVIHLSIETESARSQLLAAQQDLEPSLRGEYQIPHINDWYTVPVDHESCYTIWDPNIPRSGQDNLHPSVQHHENFAQQVYTCYFQDTHPR